MHVSTVYSCSGAPDSSSNPSLVMLTQQLVLHTAGRVLSVLHTDKSRNKVQCTLHNPLLDIIYSAPGFD